MEVVVCGDDQGYQVRRCSRCGVERTDDRKHSWCKPCVAANARERRAANPEKARAAWKASRERNHEKALASTRKWRAENKEYVSEYNAKWRAENPDAAKAATRSWRDRNREKVRGYKKAFRERNPESVAGSIRKSRAKKPDQYREHDKVHENRRRQRKANAPGDGVTPEQWAKQVEPYGNRCAYCDMVTTVSVMEHMVPLSRGGAHDICNVVPACRRCNSRKHTMTALEFFVGRRLDRKVG